MFPLKGFPKPAQAQKETGAELGAGRTGPFAGVVQHGGQFAEPPEGHRAYDGVFPLEVAVEDRLAVFDAIGQSAGSHGLPAFGLGQLASGADDDLAPLGSLALSALLSGHAFKVSPLE